MDEVYKVEGLDMVKEEAKVPETLDPAQTGSTPGNESPDCIVCFVNTKNVILLPCRHFCMCKQCSQSVKYHTN